MQELVETHYGSCTYYTSDTNMARSTYYTDCVQVLVEERLHAARLVGFVETLGGRKRFLPHIKASSIYCGYTYYGSTYYG